MFSIDKNFLLDMHKNMAIQFLRINFNNYLNIHFTPGMNYISGRYMRKF